eukprot:GHVN01009476.1.p1 GENE.GHVN01009476.1~~GHVN01009476.1.p1  ORF type:complete len:2152 (-),score=368.99 GHVN01009476.1:289-6744(-)
MHSKTEKTRDPKSATVKGDGSKSAGRGGEGSAVAKHLGASFNIDAFSCFVPRTVLEAVADKRIGYREDFDIIIEDFNSAVVFCDASGFTALTVALDKKENGAEKLGECINKFFTPLIQIVQYWGGDIIKFSGDAVTIVWPVDHEGDERGSSGSGINGNRQVGTHDGLSGATKREIDPVPRFSMSMSMAGDQGTQVNGARRRPRGATMHPCPSIATSPRPRRLLTRLKSSTGRPTRLPSTTLNNAAYRIDRKTAWRCLALHIGIGFGKVTVLQVGGTFGRWEYVVAGKPLEEIAVAEPLARVGETAISPTVANALDGCVVLNVVEGTGGYAKVIRFIQGETVERPPPLAKLTLMREDIELLKRFIPPAVFRRLTTGQGAFVNEIRQVSIVFCQVKDLDVSTVEGSKTADRLMKQTQRAAYTFEGSVNKFLVDDKGVVILLGFGLPPVFHLDDPMRALMAGLRVVDTLNQLNVVGGVGVTSGRVWCGTVGCDIRKEYTCMGDSVNMAARLMAKADVNTINCDKATYDACKGKMEFDVLQPRLIKGREIPVPMFKPTGVLKGNSSNLSEVSNLSSWRYWKHKRRVRQLFYPGYLYRHPIVGVDVPPCDYPVPVGPMLPWGYIDPFLPSLKPTVELGGVIVIRGREIDGTNELAEYTRVLGESLGRQVISTSNMPEGQVNIGNVPLLAFRKACTEMIERWRRSPARAKMREKRGVMGLDSSIYGLTKELIHPSFHWRLMEMRHVIANLVMPWDEGGDDDVDHLSGLDDDDLLNDWTSMRHRLGSGVTSRVESAQRAGGASGELARGMTGRATTGMSTGVSCVKGVNGMYGSEHRLGSGRKSELALNSGRGASESDTERSTMSDSSNASDVGDYTHEVIGDYADQSSVNPMIVSLVNGYSMYETTVICLHVRSGTSLFTQMDEDSWRVARLIGRLAMTRRQRNVCVDLEALMRWRRTHCAECNFCKGYGKFGVDKKQKTGEDLGREGGEEKVSSERSGREKVRLRRYIRHLSGRKLPVQRSDACRPPLSSECYHPLLFVFICSDGTDHLFEQQQLIQYAKNCNAFVDIGKMTVAETKSYLAHCLKVPSPTLPASLAEYVNRVSAGAAHYTYLTAKKLLQDKAIRIDYDKKPSLMKQKPCAASRIAFATRGSLPMLTSSSDDDDDEANCCVGRTCCTWLLAPSGTGNNTENPSGCEMNEEHRRHDLDRQALASIGYFDYPASERKVSMMIKRSRESNINRCKSMVLSSPPSIIGNGKCVTESSDALMRACWFNRSSTHHKQGDLCDSSSSYRVWFDTFGEGGSYGEGDKTFILNAIDPRPWMGDVRRQALTLVRSTHPIFEAIGFSSTADLASAEHTASVCSEKETSVLTPLATPRLSIGSMLPVSTLTLSESQCHQTRQFRKELLWKDFVAGTHPPFRCTGDGAVFGPANINDLNAGRQGIFPKSAYETNPELICDRDETLGLDEVIEAEHPSPQTIARRKGSEVAYRRVTLLKDLREVGYIPELTAVVSVMERLDPNQQMAAKVASTFPSAFTAFELCAVFPTETTLTKIHQSLRLLIQSALLEECGCESDDALSFIDSMLPIASINNQSKPKVESKEKDRNKKSPSSYVQGNGGSNSPANSSAPPIEESAPLTLVKKEKDNHSALNLLEAPIEPSSPPTPFILSVTRETEGQKTEEVVVGKRRDALASGDRVYQCGGAGEGEGNEDRGRDEGKEGNWTDEGQEDNGRDGGQEDNGRNEGKEDRGRDEGKEDNGRNEGKEDRGRDEGKEDNGRDEGKEDRANEWDWAVDNRGCPRFFRFCSIAYQHIISNNLLSHERDMLVETSQAARRVRQSKGHSVLVGVRGLREISKFLDDEATAPTGTSGAVPTNKATRLYDKQQKRSSVDITNSPIISLGLEREEMSRMSIPHPALTPLVSLSDTALSTVSATASPHTRHSSNWSDVPATCDLNQPTQPTPSDSAVQSPSDNSSNHSTTTTHASTTSLLTSFADALKSSPSAHIKHVHSATPPSTHAHSPSTNHRNSFHHSTPLPQLIVSPHSPINRYVSTNPPSPSRNSRHHHTVDKATTGISPIPKTPPPNIQSVRFSPADASTSYSPHSRGRHRTRILKHSYSASFSRELPLPSSSHHRHTAFNLRPLEHLTRSPPVEPPNDSHPTH